MTNQTNTKCRALFPSCARSIAAICLSVALASCQATTLFQSSFNSNVVGAPPTHAQATGTIDLSGDPGSIVVTGPVPSASENWVRISRAGAQSQISIMQCNLSQPTGDGSYTLLAALYMPTGSGLATVEFDAFPVANAIGFLHLDFTQNNTVRIDDNDAQTFGVFARDQFFTLAVTLDISATSTVAHMQLYGTGASGSMDYNIKSPGVARQFGGVRFWMGYPWTGSFSTTDILVTKKTS